MASLLQRLGSFSVRRRRLVLGGWLLALVALAGLAMAFKGTFADEFKVPGTESQRAVELIERAVPQANADGAAGRVVFAAAKGERLDKAAVEQAVQRLGGVEDVASASDPFQTGAVSKDGRIAYTDLQFSIPRDGGRRGADRRDRSRRPQPAPQVEYGGSAAAVESEAPVGEVLGVLVAMVVLAITFGSLLAAGLPLLTALFGVGVGMLGIQLASGFTDLTSTAPRWRRCSAWRSGSTTRC